MLRGNGPRDIKLNDDDIASNIGSIHFGLRSKRAENGSTIALKVRRRIQAKCSIEGSLRGCGRQRHLRTASVDGCRWDFMNERLIVDVAHSKAAVSATGQNTPQLREARRMADRRNGRGSLAGRRCDLVEREPCCLRADLSYRDRRDRHHDRKRDEHGR